MAQYKRQRVFVDPQGRVVLRQAVAYAGSEKDFKQGQTHRMPMLMLSTYIKHYERVVLKKGETDDTLLWALAHRSNVARTVSEEDQQTILRTHAYAVALKHEREFRVELEAIPKAPMTQKKAEAVFAAWKARAFHLLEIKPVYADMAKEYAKQEMLHRNGDGKWHLKT